MTTPTPGPPTGGLLAVHAHPDDETLSTGGLLAVWAADGRPVTVVTCTRGELGEVIPEGLAHLEGDGPALARWRERELAAAMRRLAVPDHLFLDTVPLAGDATGTGPASGGPGDAPGRAPGDAAVPDRAAYRDSGMAWAGTGLATGLATLPPDAFVAAPVEEAATRLARVLRERRPEVVVTYEPGGGYGHPDHVRAHVVTMRAVDLAGGHGPGADVPALAGLAPHDVRAVLWAAVADDVLRRAYAALPGLPAIRRLLDADPRLTLPRTDGAVPSVAVPAAEVDLVVDVTGVLGRVAAALGEHRTQVSSVVVDVPDPPAAPEGPSGAGPRLAGCYALSNGVLAPLLSHEAYRYAPGYPRGDVVWPGAVRPVA